MAQFPMTTAEGLKMANTAPILVKGTGEVPKVRRVVRAELDTAWGENLKRRLQLMDPANFPDNSWKSKLIGALTSNSEMFIRSDTCALFVILERNFAGRQLSARCQFLVMDEGTPAEDGIEILGYAVRWAKSTRADFEFPKHGLTDLPWKEINSAFKTHVVKELWLAND